MSHPQLAEELEKGLTDLVLGNEYKVFHLENKGTSMKRKFTSKEELEKL